MTISTRDATVVVACYTERRWEQLCLCIDSVLLEVPSPKQLIVVVDHNQKLYARVANAYPQILVMANRFEQGASGARNSAVLACQSPFIAFLDDDAYATPGWLGALLGPFEDDNVVGTGGGLVPLWESNRPPWFPSEFLWAVGASYTGMPKEVAPVRNVWSGNMAVRRETFASVGGFRLGFGKVGGQSRPEDTELSIRMGASSSDARWVYVPKAVAAHHVPSVRSTPGFFLRRCYDEGRGKVEMGRVLGEQKDLGSERDYIRKTIPAGIKRELKGAAKGVLTAGAIAVGVGAAGVGAVAAVLSRRSGESVDTPNSDSSQPSAPMDAAVTGLQSVPPHVLPANDGNDDLAQVGT